MKLKHKELLRARAQRALADLYHNATPTYPDDLYGRSDGYFESWFGNVAEFEIDYLQNGGSYGKNYHATLAASCNAGKYKSEAARRFYIDSKMHAMASEREDCGILTGWHVIELAAGNKVLQRRLKQRSAITGATFTRNNSRWEYISDYGTLYQYGRGGRTLAPDGLVTTGGGSSFGIRSESAEEERNAAGLTRLIQILESFNRCVSKWCADVPEIWRGHCAEEDAEAAAAKKRKAVRKAKETKERRYWEARDSATA